MLQPSFLLIVHNLLQQTAHSAHSFLLHAIIYLSGLA